MFPSSTSRSPLCTVEGWWGGAFGFGFGDNPHFKGISWFPLPVGVGGFGVVGEGGGLWAGLHMKFLVIHVSFLILIPAVFLGRDKMIFPKPFDFSEICCFCTGKKPTKNDFTSTFPFSLTSCVPSIHLRFCKGPWFKLPSDRTPKNDWSHGSVFGPLWREFEILHSKASGPYCHRRPG